MISKERTIEEREEGIRKLEKEIYAWKTDLETFISIYNAGNFNEDMTIKKDFDIPLRYNLVIAIYKDMFEYYIHDPIKPCYKELLMEESNG